MSHLVRPSATRGHRALDNLDEDVADALAIYTRRYGHVSASTLLLADVLVGDFRPLRVR